MLHVFIPSMQQIVVLACVNKQSRWLRETLKARTHTRRTNKRPIKESKQFNWNCFAIKSRVKVNDDSPARDL
ncbi:Uncharacterized protein APZ42_034107 [Daphnia magna]|uniref:Uncharacterized protein n=1 Tax=Daphnia magna TaxID=35525 RepID=A0A164KFK0_9CRUS|nr:Uncharacterized protein APZ42_034107 [Daphnia magna]